MNADQASAAMGRACICAVCEGRGELEFMLGYLPVTERCPGCFGHGYVHPDEVTWLVRNADRLREQYGMRLVR